TGSHDPEKPRRARAAAWVRDRSPAGTAERRILEAERRNHLHRPRPAHATRLDLRQVGHLRKQSAGALLRDHQVRAEATRTRDQELGTVRRDDAPGSATPKAGVTMLSIMRSVLARIFASFSLKQHDRDLNDEMQEHLALLQERYVRQG